MRLLRRTTKPRRSAGPRRRTEARTAPASAVTSWLRQGLSGGICPLCRVAHKADREYIWQFYDERSNDGAVIDQVSRAYGFCTDHIEMLRRIDVEDMKSTLAISTMFADAFAGIVSHLETLTPDQEFEPEPCPACAARSSYLEKNAGYLLDLLASGPAYRESFRSSGGLCFPHFELTWQKAQSAADRELVLEVQRQAAAHTLADLREHVRKHDHKFAHEPKGEEQDSWLRAIHLTAGWPPPTASAARPED
jgi:uncharacterized protein DUF6062